MRPPLQEPNQGRPQHACSCRDNLQQPVVPRRRGPWAPSLSRNGVFGAPLLGAIPTLVREYLFVAVGPHSLRDDSPGSESSPSSDGRFLGRCPLVRCTVVRWQEATDPQSPEGGSQRACFRAAVGKLSLWVASSGVLSQPPFSTDGSLGRRPSGYSLTAWVQLWTHIHRRMNLTAQ